MTDVSPPPADPIDPAPAPPAPRPRGRRRRFVWTWTRRVMALVAAIVAGCFVAFFSIDLGQFGKLTELAERGGSAWLERPLHIGKIVAFVTPGHFEVHNVMIEGLTPTDRPFFKADRISVDIAWWNIVTEHDFTLDVEMTGWQIFIESWGHGKHNLPKLKHPSSNEKKTFTTTLRFMNATNGAFGYDDHSTPWSVTAPNLKFDLVRSMDQYMGTASFDGGTVQIQHFLPMAAALSTRFTLDGGLVNLRHIDLKTDGADTHVAGQVDFAHWPEQRYNIRSQIDFARMRQIFFANETWDVGGTGDFTGIFHVYDGGQELAGDFASERARVSSLEFPDLHGSLVWFPDRFEVTHADADFYGGRTRFSYAIEPLGMPQPATQRFTAEVDDANLSALSRLMDLKGLQPIGRVDHAHATMAWPSGKFKSDVQGTVEADVSPPDGVALTPTSVSMSSTHAAGEPRELPTNTGFDPFKPLGPLATGGHFEFGFDGAGLTFDDSWAATPTTYFAFNGRTEFGQESTITFHATSLDWQASDRLLSAVLTAAGSPSGAVELGGRGSFDGTMTQTFGNPRIAGTFNGQDVEAFHVRWGAVRGEAVIANKYVDVTDGVIGDPAGSSIRTSGRFSLGFPRADHGEEVRAHVVMTNWPMDDLRHAFTLDDWPVDATIGSAEMDLYGPYTGLSGAGKIRLVDGAAWKERFESVTGDIALDGTKISIDNITMRKGAGTVTGAAVMRWTDATYSFDAKGEGIKVESLDNFKIEQAPLTGTLTFTAKGAGPFASPHYEFGGSIAGLYAGDELVAEEVTGHLMVDDKRMTIDKFDLTSFQNHAQASGSGQIVLNDQYDAELALQFLDASIDPYLKFFAPKMSPYTRAVASGRVRISGPLADYRHLSVFVTGVEGTLSLFDYELKNDGPISVTFQNDAVSIGRFKLIGEGTSLDIAGGFALDQSTIDLRANGDANLAILQGPNMHGSGHAVLHASASGSFSDPSITGYADIDGGSFRHLALPRSFTDLTGRVTFDGNAVNFEPPNCPPDRPRCGLRGKFGDGDVVFRGNISLKDFMPDQLNMSATGTAMRLRYPEGFSSTVNADLTLTGPVSAPLLAGRVDVLYAAYVKTIDTDVGIAALALGAAGGGETPSEETVAEPVPDTYPLSFNVDIRANHTLHIDNRKTATIVGSADLSYRGTLAKPSLTGHIDIDSGEVFINGNRFKIMPGTIQFANPNKLDPYFDVSAEARPHAQGETFTVGVHLTGSPNGSLNIGLHSEPSLPEVDILTMIFGGQPDVSRAELRSFQSQQQAYTTLMQSAAAQFVMSPISSRVGSVFEKTSAVDTVQFTTILPQETSLTQLSPSTRVTIGKRLSPQLYMTYSRDLNSSQYEVILVEYEYSDRLSYILSRNEDRTFALDFRVRHVF